MQLRLAFVHKRYSKRGGVERMLSVLTEGMAARGHEVTLICSKIDEKPPENVTIKKARSFGPGGIKYLLFDRDAARILGDSGCQISQGFDLTTTCDVLRVGRGLLAAYRPIVDGTRSTLDRLWNQISLEKRAMAVIERSMFRDGGAKKIVAISEAVKKEILEHYEVPASRVQVIYNGVDIDLFQRKPQNQERAQGREKFGIEKDVPVILFVGTGFRRKGLDTLLEALPKVKRSFPTVRLLVVGRDGRPDLYRRLARRHGVEDAVVWAGELDHIHKVYPVGDVLALPTRYEPFGNVVLEALASEVPVVVSQKAGAAEILEDELKTLTVSDADSVDELGNKLVKALELTSQSKGLGRLGRKIAESHSVTKMVGDYEVLYKEMVTSA